MACGCIGNAEAQEKLREIHKKTCGENDITLYRRVQRQGCYWPTMKNDAATILRACPNCSLHEIEHECNFSSEETDWRQKYIDYLKEGALPVDCSNIREV